MFSYLSRTRIRYYATAVIGIAAFLTVTSGVWAEAARPVLEPNTPVLGEGWSANGEPFRFAVVGDKTASTGNEWPVFDRALQEINGWKPDFAVMIGDMIEGDSPDPARVNEQWQEFLGHQKALTIPLFVIPGNHDIPTPPMLDRWHKVLGRSYYSFTYRGCLFIMLNNMEFWKDNGTYLGEEQIKYVEDTLVKNTDVRHTFLFMHHPAWLDPTSKEWPRIEATLKGRAHTVFAGHVHRTMFEKRNGGQYLVVSTTKGKKILSKAPAAPELGMFPHWTQVAVADGNAELTLVEPGTSRTWPANIAPTANAMALRNLIKAEAILPERLGNGTLKTGLVTEITNALPGDITVTSRMIHPLKDKWKPVSREDAKLTVNVASGKATSLTQHFLAPEAKLTPAPKLETVVTYKGVEVAKTERNVPVFPFSALRWPNEWMVLDTTFDTGEMTDTPAKNPRKEWPALFVGHPAESGYLPDKSITENGRTLTWKPLTVVAKDGSAFVDLGPISDLPLHVFTYASAYIYSPTARTAYVRFRVDDYGQLFVNGKPIDDNQVFRTRKDPIFVAIPLNQGWNNVTVKPINLGGGWAFHFLIVDPNNELRFSLQPE